jgi:hypothetical protein
MEVQMRVLMMIVGAAALCALGGCGTVAQKYHTADPRPGGNIRMEVAAARNADPFAAGRTAALAVKEKLGEATPHAVVIAECFEDRPNKDRLLKGVCSVFSKQIVFGFATYGTFVHDGCLDQDAVSVLAIGGDGVSVAASLRQDLGIAGLTMETDADALQSRLHAAGADLAAGIHRRDANRLFMVMADAHSPKNQFLVEGVQQVLGKGFPITGGSANKNAGQTFVYYQGRMYTDSAIALLLSGDFEVALSGRQAKDNDAVIASAADGAAEVMQKTHKAPFAVLAYNCAGRKGKLDNVADELAAIQTAIPKTVPMFGCYCAGEIGPADTGEGDPETLSTGVGWHVMFTVLSR